MTAFEDEIKTMVHKPYKPKVLFPVDELDCPAHCKVTPEPWVIVWLDPELL